MDSRSSPWGTGREMYHEEAGCWRPWGGGWISFNPWKVLSKGILEFDLYFKDHSVCQVGERGQTCSWFYVNTSVCGDLSRLEGTLRSFAASLPMTPIWSPPSNPRWVWPWSPWAEKGRSGFWVDGKTSPLHHCTDLSLPSDAAWCWW